MNQFQKIAWNVLLLLVVATAVFVVFSLVLISLPE